jgi:hypothetical protein
MKLILNSGLYVMSFFKKGIQSVVSIIRVILLSRPVKPLPAPTNKKASLLGNGPSLNDSVEKDFIFLKSTEMVCLNTFAASEYYELLQPPNYVLIDPAFFSEEDRTREVITSTYKALIEKTNWPLNLYVPRTSKKSFLLQNLLSHKKNITIVYFNYTIFEGFTFLKHWFFRKGLAMPQAQNVLVATLFLSINRKFDEIFLFGADHSWHEQLKLDDDNVSVYRDLHFYDKKELEYKRVNTPTQKRNMTIRFQFESLAKAFAGYEVLSEYAISRNVKVLNASARSYIDSFKKVSV